MGAAHVYAYCSHSHVPLRREREGGGAKSFLSGLGGTASAISTHAARLCTSLDTTRQRSCFLSALLNAGTRMSLRNYDIPRAGDDMNSIQLTGAAALIICTPELNMK